MASNFRIIFFSEAGEKESQKSEPLNISRLRSMRIIARIATVFALSLSFPKIIGIGPIIITPPVLISGSIFLTGVS